MSPSSSTSATSRIKRLESESISSRKSLRLSGKQESKVGEIGINCSLSKKPKSLKRVSKRPRNDQEEQEERIQPKKLLEQNAEKIGRTDGYELSCNEKEKFCDKQLVSSNDRNSVKGILNKTRVNTDFIAKLLPQGNNPEDKRYDANEINKLRLLSHSYQNFSVKLLCRLFEDAEVLGRNVYGRNYSGSKVQSKKPLDPSRVQFIKETVLRLTETANAELAWASCVIAMNRKIVEINNKFANKINDK